MVSQLSSETPIAVGLSERKTTIVLLGGRILPEQIDAADRRGARVLVVEKPQLVDQKLISSVAGRGELLSIDYEDEERLIGYLSAIHQRFPISGILSLTEFGMKPAAVARRALGFPNHAADIVEITRDKAQMRRFFASRSLAQPLAQSVTNNAELVAFFTSADGAVIVKPQYGVGSQRVSLISSIAEAEQFLFSLRERYIAEWYIEGPEYSIETMTVSGKHHVLGITETLLNDSGVGNPFLEVAHCLPATLNKADTDRIIHFAETLLTMLGHHDGPCHTEVRVNERGVWLIETHTRSAGGFISDLVHITTGLDLSDLAVARALDQSVTLPPVATALRGAAVRFFVAPTGTVRRVGGVGSFRYYPGVVSLNVSVKPGDQIRPLLSASDRIGHVLAVAHTAAEALAICDTVVAGVVIDVD